MTSTPETPKVMQVMGTDPVSIALSYISASKPGVLMDLEDFMRRIEEDKKMVHLPLFVIFKYSNEVIIKAEGPMLESLYLELSDKLSAITNFNGEAYMGAKDEAEKRVIIQKLNLLLFLFRLSLEGLYRADLTGISSVLDPYISLLLLNKKT